MFSDFFFGMADHLWQSTVFALAAGLLTLALRKNHARTRFWIWWIASVKFLVPFSLLVSLGTMWSWPAAQPADAAPSSWIVIEQFAQPFSIDATTVVAANPVVSTTPAPLPSLPSLLVLIVALWSAGSALLLVRWGIRWNHVRRLTKNALRTDELAGSREVDMLRRLEHATGIRPMTVVTSRTAIEPSIFGFFRHVLIWPAGLSARLKDGELEAILMHELSHARRRDNVTSAVHMIVESIFWFHPLVWWIGSRLLSEREKACDEHVLQWARVPHAYAEGILKVCEFCLESPLPCASGITGADLTRRIEDIMKNRSGRRLNFTRRVLLVLAGVTALTIPLAAGAIQARKLEVELIAQLESRLKRLTSSAPAPAVPIEPIEPAFPPPAQIVVQAVVQPVEVAAVQPQLTAARPAPAPQAPSQAKDAFEILSIRPTDVNAAPPPGARGGGPGQRSGGPAQPGPCTGMVQLNPGRIVIRNASLYRLVVLAYGVNCRLSTEQKLLTGGPEWLSSVAFDIEATFPEGTPAYTGAQLNNGEAPRLQGMLQNMLAERFGFAMHRDTKEIPIYNLVMVKPGRVKLSEDQTPPPPQTLPTGPPPQRGAAPPPMQRGGYRVNVDPPAGKVTLEGSGITIQSIVNSIQGGVGRMVVDKVEPKGLYDIPLITVDVGPFEIGVGSVTVWPEIMEQIGLKMEPTKGPFDTLVIDRAQKPSEN